MFHVEQKCEAGAAGFGLFHVERGQWDWTRLALFYVEHSLLSVFSTFLGF